MQQLKRREFLKTATGAVGLGLVANLPAAGGLRAAPAAPTVDRAALARLMAEMEAKGGQFLSVPREDGQFLNLLIKTAQALNVLEVGTSHGYSALWIRLALEETGGKLTTIEIRPERVEMAKKHLAGVGLGDRVEFLEGDAHEITPALKGPFDFVFLDADKGREVDYFNYLFPDKLAPGGIIAVHNAIRFRGTMSDYLEMMDTHPQFDAVMLSLTMDDGFSVAYRHRQ
jgi:caffeoyl-CoA O-methyltransferase